MVIFRAVSKDRKDCCIVMIEVEIASAITVAAIITSKIVKPFLLRVRLVIVFDRSVWFEAKNFGSTGN